MRKRCRKLTKEEKALVWAEPESNAGAGWRARGDELRDDRRKTTMAANEKSWRGGLRPEKDLA